MLHSNCGRLKRAHAQILFNATEKRGKFTITERQYYASALEHYNKSLGALRERKHFPEVWDRISWELSGTYFTVGTLAQDYCTKEETEAEREISDVLFKSLKYCEGLVFPNEDLQRDVQHRIGSIHFRLASLYHNSYRMIVSLKCI